MQDLIKHLTENQQRYFRASARNADPNAQRAYNWVVGLSVVAESLAHSGGQPGIVPVFWIRLQGVLHEITECCKRQYESVQEILAKWPELKGNPSIPDAEFAAIYAKCAAIRAVFSDEEVILIEYMRVCHAHPFPDTYFLGMGEKGKLKETRSVPVLGEKFQRETLELIVDGQLKRLGGESRAALDFASRVYPVVGELVETMRPVYTPQEVDSSQSR